jgi:hypothetical protein
MRVLYSDPAAELIDERGGRLYVWPKSGRCCGSFTMLATATDPPPGREFRRVEAGERFELYISAGLARLPDELHLDVRRFPRRVDAYWNGCAWVA